MYLSNIDRQLDAKRRIVLPIEFRAAAAGPFEEVYCFPSIEADCIEGGGKALFDTYVGIIESLPFGDGLRSALETSVIGSMVKISWDPAGRITLPEAFCEMFGLTDWVTVVGLRDRFQIWSKDAFAIQQARARQIAREGLAALAAQQRQSLQAVAS